ncbi:hypothetical protein IPA_07150 [Ignicoccus pacificus DSM 13166]|uniref:Uncharacterized protein n=1 Tax=Ignicoccus pacificus DSM 13166 TaxID=940294 RepID=A0A977K9V9_9CREN|nr:hypothetical protein IPA_07150 [Ignicoccus pacificus DSM 13166]
MSMSDRSAEVDALMKAKESCIPSPLVNGIVAAYQIAITKTLGSASNAMAQMLLTELGELLSKYVDEVLGEADYSNVEETVRRAFKELGLAEEVNVKKEDSKRWVIEIKGSVFIPTYRMLKERGVQFFTLSPEALLVASIIRRHLREAGEGNERVRVKAEVPEDDVLRFIVERIQALRR